MSHRTIEARLLKPYGRREGADADDSPPFPASFSRAAWPALFPAVSRDRAGSSRIRPVDATAAGDPWVWSGLASMCLKTRRIKAPHRAAFHLLLRATHGMNGHAQDTPMTNFPYIFFNQSPEQLRRIGARGGKAQARNRRARLQAQTQARPHRRVVLPPTQTTAQAIAVLDARFPWLCGAEKRSAPRRLPQP